MKVLLDRFAQRLLGPNAGSKADLCGTDASHSVESSLAATQREAALFAAELTGAQSYPGQFETARITRATLSQFAEIIEAAPAGYMVIDPRPGLQIVEMNHRFETGSLVNRRQALNRKLFDVFPDNPAHDRADGVINLFHSIQRAAQSGEAHRMATQRYDVRDADGRFVHKVWRPVNVPLFATDGRLAFILHYANPVGDCTA